MYKYNDGSVLLKILTSKKQAQKVSEDRKWHTFSCDQKEMKIKYSGLSKIPDKLDPDLQEIIEIISFGNYNEQEIVSIMTFSAKLS